MLYKENPLPLEKYNLAQAEQEGIKFFQFLGVSSLAEARKLDAEFIRDKSL